MTPGGKGSSWLCFNPKQKVGIGHGQLWMPAVLLGVTGKVQFGAIPGGPASTSYVNGGHTTHSDIHTSDRYGNRLRMTVPYIRSTVLVVKMTHYTRSSDGFSSSEPDYGFYDHEDQIRVYVLTHNT